MDLQERTYPGLDDEVLSDDYRRVEEHLPDLTEPDICGVAAALVAELVNRGYDTESALRTITESAMVGATGSKTFDQLQD